jgi:ATP-dependent RNA helicase RhlE
MKFDELKLAQPLAPSVLKALRAMAFETPTPIQEAAIPVGCEGKDLIAIAETGTGKTGAFTLPMITRLLAKPNEIALVLAPTRELALQIEEFVRTVAQFTPGMKSVTLVGGLAMGAQTRGLAQRPRILIATPGRLIDHLERGSAPLSKVGLLVLDEADRMLDMGFQPQLERILRALPKQRQTLLFSATWGREMDRLSAKYLSNPSRVGTARESKAANSITQKAMNIQQPRKNESLLDELNRREGSVLVFARTQARVDRVAKYLNSYGIEAARIHGGRTQAQRNGALAAFKDGRTRFLVATDIAARGIDVTGIGHVINYDLPQVAEDYIHRIGRTGRNGLEGEAMSFVTPEDRGTWREIVRLLQKSGSNLPEVIAVPPRPEGAAEKSAAMAAMAPRDSVATGVIRDQSSRGDRDRRDFRGDSRRNDRPRGSQGPQPSQRDSRARRWGQPPAANEGASSRDSRRERPSGDAPERSVWPTPRPRIERGTR